MSVLLISDVQRLRFDNLDFNAIDDTDRMVDTSNKHTVRSTLSGT